MPISLVIQVTTREDISMKRLAACIFPIVALAACSPAAGPVATPTQTNTAILATNAEFRVNRGSILLRNSPGVTLKSQTLRPILPKPQQRLSQQRRLARDAKPGTKRQNQALRERNKAQRERIELRRARAQRLSTQATPKQRAAIRAARQAARASSERREIRQNRVNVRRTKPAQRNR